MDGSTPEPASVTETTTVPFDVALGVSSRTRGGVLSSSQNRNENAPAPAAVGESKTTSYAPGAGTFAPDAGDGSRYSGTYGFMFSGSDV